MKKSLLALAAMGAFVGAAHAQSSVTVYGILDVGLVSETRDATNQAGTKTTNNIDSTGKGRGYTTSRLGFRGTEDLGKGLRAGFNLEFGINQNDTANSANSNTVTALGTAGTTVDSGSDTALPVALRLANVSLGGAFGTITLGRQSTAVESAWGAGDVGGANNFIGRAYTVGFGIAANSIASAAATNNITKQNNDRSDRLVTYATPNMSGFVATVQYGKGKNNATDYTAATDQTEMGAALSYSAGPAQVVLGYVSEELTLNGAAINNGKPLQMVLGANYDFKVAKAFLSVSQGSNKTAAGVTKNERAIQEIGVSVPLGALVINASALMGSYTPNDGNDKGKISGMQFGVNYNLSKRTMAYGVYGQDKVDGITTTGLNKEYARSNYGVGIRHTF
jgi:predicted porin